MRNYHPDIEASLLRFCADFAAEFNLETLYLDAHTDEAQWPNADFIGLGELNQDITEFFEGQCVIALSTVNDTNLQRMRELMDPLVTRLLPKSSLPVYDKDTGVILGNLFVLNGVRVGAPVQTKTQPIRPVMISFVSDLTSV